MKHKMLILGHCIEEMKKLPESSIDSLVTDPPYGWRFMGKAWDGADIQKVFERDRTMETDGKTTLGMAAGKYNQSLQSNKQFQEWTTLWAKEAYRILKPGAHALIFCGPRTYHRMASGIEDAGFEVRDQIQWLFGSGFPKSHNLGNGWGTALKPANEPILLARKPCSEKTVAANVLKHGTGGINIDASRIGPPQGRFPANLMISSPADDELDIQAGDNVSRFFYCAKASKSEKNAGCEGLEQKKSDYRPGDEEGRNTIRERLHNSIPKANHHPTVKPIKLMSYLITLITPIGGTCLDPFLGSGSTGIAAVKSGFGFIGIEKEPEYMEIARTRIEYAERELRWDKTQIENAEREIT